MKDAIGNIQRVLVLGGSSEIALATVVRLAGPRHGVRVTLAARPGERRAAAAAALHARGLEVTEVNCDVAQRSSYEAAITSTFETDGDVDVVIVAFGVLGDQERAWQDLDPAPLSQLPEQVAEIIVAGLRDGRRTVWSPPALRWVMSALRHLPAPAFRRLPM